MDFFRSKGKDPKVGMAVGVIAAEAASYIYFMCAPWILLPSERYICISVLCNVILSKTINELAVKYRQWQDAFWLMLYLTAVYVTVTAPYQITLWNPLTIRYIIGPAIHAFIQISAITASIWYFKYKK